MSGSTPTSLNRSFLEAGLLTLHTQSLLNMVMAGIERMDAFEAFRATSQNPSGLIVRFSDQLDAADALADSVAGVYIAATEGVPAQIVLNPLGFNGRASTSVAAGIAEVLLHEYSHHLRAAHRYQAQLALEDTSVPAAQRAHDYVSLMLDDETRSRYDGYLALRDWQRTYPTDAGRIEVLIQGNDLWKKFAELDAAGDPAATLSEHIASVVTATRGVMARYSADASGDGSYLRSFVHWAARHTGVAVPDIITDVRSSLPSVSAFALSEDVQDDGSSFLTLRHSDGSVERFTVGTDGRMYGWQMTRPDGSGGAETYGGTGEVTSRSIVRLDGAGTEVWRQETVYDASGQVTQTTVSQRQPDGSTAMTVRNGQGALVTSTRRQVFDDPDGQSTLEEVTNHATGQVTLVSTGADGQVLVRDITPLVVEQRTRQQIQDTIYGDAAGFVGAVRSGNKAGMLLYGARMALGYARLEDVTNPSLAGLDSFLGGAIGALGIIGALRGLRSDDPLTQVNSAVSLVRSANEVYKAFNSGSGFIGQGTAAAKLLEQVSSVVSILNLANLDDMLENGQVGSAAMTVINAINGAAYLAGGATSAFGATAFIPIPGPWMVALAIASLILDDLFGEEPPPPPPVGEVVFVRNADGTLGYQILNAANGGEEILTARMNELLAKLGQQLAEANDGNTDPDRVLQLVASRMPKISIQSWPSFDAGNNYFFVIESVNPMTGESHHAGIARQDLVDHYAESLVFPEAIAQQWELTHLSRRFGGNEADWRTEGQWLATGSTVEQQRLNLKQAVTSHESALDTARENQLQLGAWSGTGLLTGNVEQGLSPQAQAIAAAEAALAAARDALEAFEALHPVDPQEEARIIDPSLADADQIAAAREAATRQWLKVVAIDFGGDGVRKIALASPAGKDLASIRTDGIARFDVDNDGYREATEWIVPSEALLGIDRDGNGVLDTANELFNGIGTPFDKRGLASLAYYDTNGDSRIDAADPVYQMLRLWMDLNGDGSAGTMETFDLQMRHPGVDMAALRSRLDATGQAALDLLQNSRIAFIDLATFRVHLADQTTAQAVQVDLQAETEGIALTYDEDTQNVAVVREGGARENYITFVEDMTALLELRSSATTAARRAELEALALRWGLNPHAAGFQDLVDSLRAGGQNLGGSGVAVYLGSDDVWADPNIRQHLESMRFRFHAAHTVGGSDVFGTARLGAPAALDGGVTTVVIPDHWYSPHHVQQSEVQSDAPVAPDPSSNAEQWVLPGDVYNLDHVVRGAQLGGEVREQTVIASNAANPSAPPRPIQVYTAAAPTFTLASATIQGREDQQFGFGYAQLELEARNLIPDASAFAAVRLLGVRSVAHGRVELDEASGRVRFIADQDYYGSQAGFSYAVVDDLGRVMERRVDFNLVEDNDAPDVLGETVQAREDVPLVLGAATLLANDSDLEGDALTIIGIGRIGMGRAQLQADGNILYTPPADLYDVTDTIEYIVRDARGATAVGVVKITLHAEQDAPTVVSELIRNAKEDTNLRIDPALLLANDYDPDFHNDTGAAQLRITAVGAAAHGSVFLDASGHVIFVPTAHYHGTASFEYTVTDGTGLSTTGHAEVEVGAVNDGPRASGELITSEEDRRLVIDPDLLLANDEDEDIHRGEGQRLMVVAVDQAVNGTVALEDGHVTFTPAANFVGEASFRYTVSDGAGGFSQAVARVQLSNVNDAPTVLNRSYVGTEDTPHTFTPAQLLAGIVDVDDAPGQVTLVSVSVREGGTLQLVGGTYVLTPGANFNGTAMIEYVVSDPHGAQATGLVSIAFSAINDAPVFIPNSQFTRTGEEDQDVRISESAILKMFVDVDGHSLTVDPASLAAVQPGDTVRWDAERREVVFRAAANQSGVRHFDVRVRDSEGLSSAPQRMEVALQALNDSPLVNAFAFRVQEDGGQRNPKLTAPSYIYKSTMLHGLASDAENDPLSVAWAGNGRTGDGQAVNVWIDGDRVGMELPLNYNGTITFEYTVSDGRGGVTRQTAYGVVTPVDDAPKVEAVRLANVLGFEAWTIEATDVDGSVVSYGIERHPLRGTIEFGRTVEPVTLTDEYGHSHTAHAVVPGGPNDLWIDVWDGKGYAAEEQTAIVRATDNGGNSGYAHLNFVFRWDPIVIDLDSDGLEFLDFDQSQVSIDRDGDGSQERSSWIRGTEGILAWDYDGNNQIGYDEIEFWTHVDPEDPTRTDLQSLARPEFDSNQDGIFDALDTRWAQFRMWRDVNENGVTDAGELQTLDQAGIRALHLHTNVLNRRYGSDVLLRGYTRVEMTDGRMLQAGDVQLAIEDPTIAGMIPNPGSGAQQATGSTLDEYRSAAAREREALEESRRAGDSSFSGAPRAHKVLAGSTYRYVLPVQIFPELDAGTTYEVKLANGLPLPAWLAYDAATRTLSGTPQAGQLGSWAIKVTGTAPGGAVASAVVDLEVAAYNQAPIVHGRVPTQYAREDDLFQLEIAPNFFLDRELGDSLRYTATLADGSPLPAWLAFEPETLRLVGHPPESAAGGTLQIRVTAFDEANASAESSFKLVISGVNDAPIVNNAPAMVGMRVGEANRYELPADMFVDADMGDVLTWEVTLANGGALPNWLSFSPADRALVGAPTREQLAMPIQLSVGVTDRAGVRTATLITLTSQIFGTAANDGALASPLIGSDYSEDVWGLAGNDVLDGRGGADRLIGGAGDDTYIVDRLDTVLEASGQGVDTVVSAGSWMLDDTLENLVLTGAAAINGTGNASRNVLTGNAGANVLSGGAGDDTYHAGAEDTVVESVDGGIDTVHASGSFSLSSNVEDLVLTGAGAIHGTGNALDNTITGNSGDNHIDGGAGADVMTGGVGDDTYTVDEAGDSVVEAAGEGTDTVTSWISYTLGTHFENLVLAGSAAINGTGNSWNNWLSGNGGANVLAGGMGDDTLDGGAGADEMAGGTGDDTYTVDQGGDTVIEAAGQGTDTVISWINYTLGAHFENLVLTGNAAINGTGNSSNNWLSGNSGVNVLAGGTGDDTYVVGAGDSVVEAAGEGTDTVRSEASHVLAANVEHLVLTGTTSINGTGNSLGNVITGNAAANVLDGGAGADTLAGGAGDDTYVVNISQSMVPVGVPYDLVVENANEGIDTVQSSTTWTLGANLENLVLTGVQGSSGTGNALDNTLHGNTSTGQNFLNGRQGNDTYFVGAGDTTGEFAGEGYDTVYSHASHKLGANVEKLVLLGSGTMAAEGNELDNVLVGNGGRNTMLAYGGNDVYVVGRGGNEDTIGDFAYYHSGFDIVHYLPGVAHTQLWFRLVNEQPPEEHWQTAMADLEVSIIGTDDRVVISQWWGADGSGSFSDAQWRGIDQFRTEDGARTLSQANVQALVDAMAQFQPPAPGQTTLPANYAAALNSVIAANWQ